MLHSLRDSNNPAYSENFQTLKEELTVNVISEAQFVIPGAFKAQAKFVCDALRWTRMKGRILHVSSGNVAPWPHGLWGRTVRCARAVRKVGHHPPPVGSFLGVGLPQGTIAIVYPCSINPPPSCVYVPLQTGTLRPVYGHTFSGCLPQGIIFCSHFSDPLLHSPWTLMLEIGCSTLAPMGCEFVP